MVEKKPIKIHILKKKNRHDGIGNRSDVLTDTR